MRAASLAFQRFLDQLIPRLFTQIAGQPRCSRRNATTPGNVDAG